MKRSSAVAPWLLVLAGVLFILYPATRPWHDETTAEGLLAATGSPWWVASHGFAMVGFVVLGFAFSSIGDLLADSPGARPARRATLSAWIAAGLLLPYYGAETFGLYAMAQADVSDPVALADDFRFGAVAVTTFGLGWLALGASAVLLAIAVHRSELLSRNAGVILAAGLVLFLPQFFGPPAVRIGHGILIGAGCVILAAAVLKSQRANRR